MRETRILVVGLALACLALCAAGCKDNVHLGDVKPVATVGEDWNSDGVVDPLPADPGDGDYLLDFGQVVVLQRATRVVVLGNAGNANDDLHLTSVTLTDDSSPDFYLDPPPVNDLAPGEATYFTVNYIPDADGPDSGAVVIESNDPDHPRLVVTLAGEGVSPDVQVCLVGADGELCNDEVAPSNLSADFGMLDLGDSADQQVVVRNLGEYALTLSSVGFNPNSSRSEFFLDGAQDAYSGSLQPGEEKTFTVTYSPKDGGADQAKLEVSSNDPDEASVIVNLVGNGLAPKICPEPPFLVDFGSIWVNTTSQKSYTFTSCGNQTLTITSLDLDSGVHGFFSFTVDVPTPFDLSPGESFEVQLTYAPTSTGAHAGKLTIHSNDPAASEGYIDLVGQATDKPSCNLSVQPATVAFGSVSTSGYSNKTVNLINNGDANCDITAVQGPDGSAEFSFPAAPFTGTIQPGDMRSFDVRYTPVDEGADQGTLTVVHEEDSIEQQVVVNLTGTGVQPPPCDLQADPALLNFGSVPVAGHAELTTTIHNFGGEDCYITSADLTASSDTSFHPAALTFPPPELAPGETYDLVVAVEPEHGGVLAGQIVIKGSDTNPFFGTPMSTVNLSAGGQAAQMCLDPDELRFSGVAVGDHRDMSFNIRACGPGNLRIRQIAFDGASPDFTFASVPGAPRTIPAGTSHTVTVRYSPTDQGSDFGRVLISGNADSDPNGVVELVGNYEGSCPAVFDCQPDALWFEQTEVGRSREQSFICTNHGVESLTVTGVDLGAGTSPEFHLGVDPMPQTIGPNESLYVEVGYVPSDVGPDNGSVVISSTFTSDACDNFTLITIPLEAEGVTPDLPPCIGPQDFQPELIFDWPDGVASNVTDPTWKQVFMTPVVINLTDDNSDGFIDENDVPDIVFNSYDYFHTTNPVITPAKLRAISGDDGHEIWTITDTQFRTNNESQVAAGDIDGDNLPEILASKYVVTDSGDITGQYVTGNILCFEHDGRFKWESEAWHAPEDDIEDGSAISIADLDHDGHPEIIRGSSVFNYRGELLWEGEAGRGSNGHGVFSTAADLDMTGNMELVCGNTAYRSDGTIFWQVSKPDGMAAVADFNQDGLPEVVLSASGFGGGVFILDGQTGAILSTLGDSEVNAILVPVIADIDGSGGPEIGMVGTCQDQGGEDGECFWGIDVNESNLQMTVLWKELLNDSTLGGGNSAFDFEGDGTFEVVQNDESYVNVYRGLAHDQIYQAERWSITGWENPLIVDVNNDDHAEIIVIENGGFGNGGILVYGNAGATKWVKTKRVWNQFDYHITNIRENGTIPRFEVPNWTVYNNFLTNEPFCE